MDKMTPANSPLVTKKHDNHMEDKMSNLPDEILVRVLSHLLTKEAARTSVLSRRWVKLWTFVPILKFDHSGRIYYARDGTQILRMEKAKLINCVNQALKSHRGQTIEEFIVHFDLVKNVSSHIDSWIDFAKNRRVQRLELGCSWKDHYGHYTFPLWAVKFSTFNSLTDLCLSSVNVRGEVLEHLLFNCRNLERLCIAWSMSRVSLKVSGLPLKLKNLEIYMCNNIESIDISATNLESFRCLGNKINIPFNNFPALVTASFEGDFGEFVTNNFCQFSSYFTRLEALTLEKELEENTTEPLNFAVLSNVKHLELRVSGCSCRILPFIISIIKAFPSLHRFVLRKYMMGANIQSDTRREPTKSPYKFLKVVELLGFDGSEQDVEIAMYFIANAVSMETLVFDTRNQSALGTRWEGLFQDVEEQQAARNCARQLGGKLPLETHFVVI